MRAHYLPEVFVGLLILLLGGLLFVLTAGYVVVPAWVWIFGPVGADQPWVGAIPLLASALLVWMALRGLGRLADFLILRAEKRRADARRPRDPARPLAEISAFEQAPALSSGERKEGDQREPNDNR